MGDNKSSLNNMSFQAVAAVVFYTFRESHDYSSLLANESVELKQPLAHPSKLLGYATIHRVENGQYTAGQPINAEFLTAMSSMILPKTSPESFFLHDRAVYFSARTRQLVWWKPAGPHHILFAHNTGIKSGTAKLPPLLFCYFEGTLEVFALKKDARPNAETLLYQGPFFNAKCMGNVRMPSYAYPSDCEKLEDLFFTSEFTLNVKPVLEKVDPIDLWTSLMGGADFPMECLVQYRTLREHITADRDADFGA